MFYCVTIPCTGNEAWNAVLDRSRYVHPTPNPSGLFNDLRDDFYSYFIISDPDIVTSDLTVLITSRVESTSSTLYGAQF